MVARVSLVIVSHSLDVAKGTYDMAKQMVGEEVQIAYCGGDTQGGLGTSCEEIMARIKSVFTSHGVAVLVDLGGAETNSEMAIEMLPTEMKDKVVICNAPLVEGAIMAATEASSGAELETVRKTAEEY